MNSNDELEDKVRIKLIHKKFREKRRNRLLIEKEDRLKKYLLTLGGDIDYFLNLKIIGDKIRSRQLGRLRDSRYGKNLKKMKIAKYAKSINYNINIIKPKHMKIYKYPVKIIKKINTKKIVKKKKLNKNGYIQEESGKLERLFRIPPVSSLSPSSKRWQIRRKEWMTLGIQSELGREDNLLHNCDLMRRIGHKSISIFDPVLTEIMYLWFSKKGDRILDPFAGGSVRGIIASELLRDYTGIDLSKNQIEHNKLQAKEICSTHMPIWIQDDSNNIDKIEGYFDMILTCPPYFNLEKYSNNVKDLSNMDLNNFFINYNNIIKNSVNKLKTNSFAIFVVGDVRGRDGNYIGLPHKTIEAFELCGLKYYNELILSQPIVNGAMRAERMMNASRKIPKTHQKVLIFIKGNPVLASNRLGEVELI